MFCIKQACFLTKLLLLCFRMTQKKGFLPTADRVALIKESVKDYENVEVDSFDGLTIEYAKAKGSNVLIRGLRAVSDFEYEMQLSQTNNALAPEITTVFLITKPKYNFISSSTVKEIAKNNGDISKFVPPCVVEYFHKI